MSRDWSSLPETAELRVTEAVPLAHALDAQLAELERVRILCVKGPTAVALGVRPPRPSSDVDVLCEPGGMERLGAALETCGWRRRVPASANSRLQHAAIYLFDHSVHYIHDEWPCDLDVHYSFPGFLAPDEQVFETLWARRAEVLIANTPVPAADLLGQAALVGLHALRDGDTGLYATDVDHLQAVLAAMSPADKAAMGTLAGATGCSKTLHPLLDPAGVPFVAGPWNSPETLRRWKAQTENAGTHTTAWLIELRATPWHRKPGLVAHALWLPRKELMSTHVGAEPTWRLLTRLQAQRWLRAIRYARRGLAAARRSERPVS